jgi:hypothetical protein
VPRMRRALCQGTMQGLRADERAENGLDGNEDEAPDEKHAGHVSATAWSGTI